MSVEDVKAGLRQANQAADTAQMGMVLVRDNVDEVRTIATAVLEGSRHEHVDEGLAKLRMARKESDQVLRLLKSCHEASATYAERM